MEVQLVKQDIQHLFIEALQKLPRPVVKSRYGGSGRILLETE